MTEAMLIVFPDGPMAVSDTGTPVTVVLRGCCSCKYACHTPWSTSAIAGVSGCPDDWSVTVPCIIMLYPWGMAVNGAETVVALGPLPKQYIRLSYALYPTK